MPGSSAPGASAAIASSAPRMAMAGPVTTSGGPSGLPVSAIAPLVAQSRMGSGPVPTGASSPNERSSLSAYSLAGALTPQILPLTLPVGLGLAVGIGLWGGLRDQIREDVVQLCDLERTCLAVA